MRLWHKGEKWWRKAVGQTTNQLKHGRSFRTSHQSHSFHPLKWLHRIACYLHSLPLKKKRLRLAIGIIDGNHNFNDCLRQWEGHCKMAIYVDGIQLKSNIKLCHRPEAWWILEAHSSVRRGKDKFVLLSGQTGSSTFGQDDHSKSLGPGMDRTPKVGMWQCRAEFDGTVKGVGDIRSQLWMAQWKPKHCQKRRLIVSIILAEKGIFS